MYRLDEMRLHAHSRATGDTQPQRGSTCMLNSAQAAHLCITGCARRAMWGKSDEGAAAHPMWRRSDEGAAAHPTRRATSPTPAAVCILHCTHDDEVPHTAGGLCASAAMLLKR